MVIYRDGSEIRVERSEKRTRNTLAAGTAAFALVAGYFATMADSGNEWVIVGTTALAGVVLGILTWRRRHVCIIGPDRIEWGQIGGKMMSCDRAEIHSVKITNNFFVQVQLLDAQDKLRGVFVLSYFEPKEVLEAFEEAGLRVR